jgi:hypothetical protein
MPEPVILFAAKTERWEVYEARSARRWPRRGSGAPR